MQKFKNYTFIFSKILFISLFLNACASQDVAPVDKIVCPKSVKEQALQGEQDVNINIDKVVVVLPKAEKEKVPKKKTQKKRTKKKVKKKTQAKKRDLLKVKKSIGDRVCRNAKGLLSSMSLDLVGVVQKKKGDSIEVKIIESHSDNSAYDGIGLYRYSVVWDKYYNWKVCK